MLVMRCRRRLSNLDWLAVSNGYSGLEGSTSDVYSLVVIFGTATPSELTQPVKGAADDGLIFYPTGSSFDGRPPSCAPVRDPPSGVACFTAECRVAQAMRLHRPCSGSCAAGSGNLVHAAYYDCRQCNCQMPLS